MKQKILAFPCILLAVAVIMSSCSKTGPTGPAGTTGPAGPSGSTGPSGPAGATGTANVIYSAWLNVTFQGSDTTGWNATIPAPKLDDAMLNTGEVKVYFNFGSDSANSNLVLPLPLDGYLLGVVAEPYFVPGAINIIASADISSFTDNGNHYFQFRYILVPGGTTALPASINGKNNIDWNDYNQVKAYLGLKD